MIVRPGRLVIPGPIASGLTFYGVTPFPQSGGRVCVSDVSDSLAAPHLLISPRLLVPPSATVKRSLWVFRARKPKLVVD